MIARLSRQTVRHTWPAYAGAFVALTFGVVLLGVTVAVIGAVAIATDAPGVTGEERVRLDDLSAMFGIMSGVSLFMALFVVGSTFGFVVAARRRELGLLRLVGATPRQVRRLVLAESGVVAVAATAAGCLATTALTPAALWAIRAYGLTGLHLEAPAWWIPWAIAGPCGAAVALLGARRSSKRASKVPPAAALREAAVERRRPSVAQIVVGGCCLAIVAVVAALAGSMPPLFAMLVAVFLPAVMVIGVMCFGTLILPALAAVVARPFVNADVTARMARDQLTAATRTTASLAAPVMAISAVAGSLILTLSFTTDWVIAQDRARLTAPLVVETGSPDAADAPDAAELVAADPTVATVDARRQVSIGVHGGPHDVDVIDRSTTAAVARGLRAVKGDLEDVHGRAVAVTEGWTIDYGSGLGDTVPARVGGQRVRLEIVAVVADAPHLYNNLIVREDLVAEQLTRVSPDLLFVVPRSDVAVEDQRAAVASTLDGTGARVLRADAWLSEVDAQSREESQVGLWVLLGPAGLYAGIAMVNATLIGASQRRRQDAVVRLLGATPHQVRRMAVWESGFIGAAGLVVGGLVTGSVAWVVRSAISRDVAGAGMTVPWLPILGIGATCILLVVTSAVVGARVHTVAGRRVAEPAAT